jgi:hypothetical protein
MTADEPMSYFMYVWKLNFKLNVLLNAWYFLCHHIFSKIELQSICYGIWLNATSGFLGLFLSASQAAERFLDAAPREPWAGAMDPTWVQGRIKISIGTKNCRYWIRSVNISMFYLEFAHLHIPVALTPTPLSISLTITNCQVLSN